MPGLSTRSPDFDPQQHTHRHIREPIPSRHLVWIGLEEILTCRMLAACCLRSHELLFRRFYHCSLTRPIPTLCPPGSCHTLLPSVRAIPKANSSLPPPRIPHGTFHRLCQQRHIQAACLIFCLPMRLGTTLPFCAPPHPQCSSRCWWGESIQCQADVCRECGEQTEAVI